MVCKPVSGACANDPLPGQSTVTEELVDLDLVTGDVLLPLNQTHAAASTELVDQDPVQEVQV